jgi:hypothetical protein
MLQLYGFCHNDGKLIRGVGEIGAMKAHLLHSATCNLLQAIRRVHSLCKLELEWCPNT